MSSQNFETLSAMLDSEAGELELRRIIKQSGHDAELSATWERMCLVQSVLHDDNLQSARGGSHPGLQFSQSVAAAVAAEPIPRARPAAKAALVRPLARFAIAASVAVAFLLGMQVSVRDSGQSAVPVADAADRAASRSAAQDPAVQLAGGTDQLATMAAAQQVDPQARQRLEEYIRSASITRQAPPALQQLEESPLYRLVNQTEDSQ